MSHVVFYLTNGQVISQAHFQDGNEHLATNPATDLKIIVDDVPDAPIPQWRVINGELSVVDETVDPDYSPLS